MAARITVKKGIGEAVGVAIAGAISTFIITGVKKVGVEVDESLSIPAGTAIVSALFRMFNNWRKHKL